MPIRPPILRLLLLGLLTASVSAAAAMEVHAENFIWVDANGVTRLTNDRDTAPEEAHGEGDVDRLRDLWGDGLTGPVPDTPPGGSGSEADRIVRLLRGAVQDLERGEAARATAALRSARRIDPSRPEPYWYLAMLDRRRGRYGRAAENFRHFLERAGDDLADWKALARRRLNGLEDERRLANDQLERGPLELVQYEGDHFHIQLDAELNDVRSDYAVAAMSFLEEARGLVEAQVGVTPGEPLGVVFYGRAAYSKAHAHRFSFQTIGFFDGRIHVSSPAHPSQTLRALLFHEYTHAVFRAETGGDRPYWLNEGLAEVIERSARRRPSSTRSERASLRQRISAGDWIPLRRLAPSFSGLDDEDARAAYMQSIVAVEWIHAHSTAEQRRRMLRKLGQGFSADQALHEMLGLDTEGLEKAVRMWIESEFPVI